MSARSSFASGTITTVIPAALPAETPIGASSKTKHDAASDGGGLKLVLAKLKDLRVRFALGDHVACDDVVKEAEKLRVLSGFEIKVSAVRGRRDSDGDSVGVEVANELVNARKER
eukprot:CAMPEP_0177754858 /NCGR_PEP_ID=MMETSP0491_2-20121128/2240_1 /TAXON_ID=63592 /ORGANISM="Tetraselmis chuii, Strain PLY429" /LENGTH=114 /DNA_ID=CAMNT_0019270283 /DNA_START=404 /DNA_END=747 /DNA_ORIENTATION=+